MVVLSAITLSTVPADAYSILTHEELIDLAWNGCIRPLLLARFPGATDAQLAEPKRDHFTAGVEAVGDLVVGHAVGSVKDHFGTLDLKIR
jgi:hypothetical protein